jgi:hypothetical protein
MVVIALLPTALTGSAHDRTDLPSTCTVQQPHWAAPQPNFVPTRPNVSRNTQSNGVSASTSTSWVSPLMVRRVIPSPNPLTGQPRLQRGGSIHYHISAKALHTQKSDCQAIWMLWFFSGNERTRWPVALKYALSTAGAATQMVGSPIPPHGTSPPGCRMIDSTFGISAIRIEL